MKKISLITSLLVVLLFSCKKNLDHQATQEEITAAGQTKDQGHLQQAKTFASDVVVSWLNMQMQMVKVPLPAGTAGQGTDRCQAYCGIALYESVVPGMPAYQSLTGQLTAFPAMPSTEPGKAYNWAASANAALAEMNRRLFPATAAANKFSMDSLENSWQARYAAQTDEATMQRSVAFGKEVATRVFNWAATDGSATVYPPYIPPVGVGLWVPTASTPPVNPYASQMRLLVPGSADNTELTPPPAFSTVPGSAFYNMVKEVYDARRNITDEQKALADYFKDAPGYTPGGTYLALMTQALDLTKPMLDMAALTYVKVGLATRDASTILFINKYIFNVIRPITYIRANIDPNWNTYIPTPNHPEFPSGHSTSGGAILEMMRKIFGEDFHITLHTYDYLHYPPRTYTSFTQLSNDISDSRFYGGLHYRATLDKSTAQGKKVADNILSTVKFLKE
jgi:hypothetical protein